MLPVFYPIFDCADWFERLLPLGVRLAQLRVKERPPAAVKREIRRARDLARRYHCQLVVNDYWELAIELGCDFVHLGQTDVESADLAAVRRAGLRLGLSTHSAAERDAALALAPDYIALGPVYPTTLKAMPWPAQGLARVTEWKQAVGATPLVAIGGMTLERAQGALDAGADAVSLVTDISRHADPAQRVRQWVAWDKGQRAED